MACVDVSNVSGVAAGPFVVAVSAIGKFAGEEEDKRRGVGAGRMIVAALLVLLLLLVQFELLAMSALSNELLRLDDWLLVVFEVLVLLNAGGSTDVVDSGIVGATTLA